jgi:hypothetical protein
MKIKKEKEKKLRNKEVEEKGLPVKWKRMR